MKPPILYMGLHPPHPILQFTPLKFENLNKFNSTKHSNLALYGILVLNKSKYPIISVGLCPPDPLLQRYYTRVTPLPIYTPDSDPPFTNPGSAPAVIPLVSAVYTVIITIILVVFLYSW